MTSLQADPSVTTLLLNYNASPDMMSRCLRSIEAQDYANNRILLVDNASSENILPRIASEHPDIELLPLDRNYGFAGGVNRGIDRVETDFVFLLNFDTVLEPDCISRMVEVALQNPDAAGVSPKMMSASHPQIFDSVGIGMAEQAAAFNLGIGQPDIGQYDLSEKVFGACFGAALLRREAFDLSRVGPLDEDYFMYYEDADWCYRANLLGYGFVTAPRAVVHHDHSVSVKDKGFAFKYELIELNLLRTAVKNYQRQLSVRIPAQRIKIHLKNMLSPDFPWRWASLKIIISFLLDVPRLAGKRTQIQKRRKVGDEDIRRLSYREKPYYDPSAYEPLYDVEALMVAYRRLHAITGNEEALVVWRSLEALNKSKIRYNGSLLKERLDKILKGQPDHVLDFAQKIGQTH